LLDGV